MNRFYGRATRAVRKSWHMYPLGCLFGLGFDTATEVALLVLAGAGAASGLPFYAILCLPILFAAGMSLFDTHRRGVHELRLRLGVLHAGPQDLLQPHDHRASRWRWRCSSAGSSCWRCSTSRTRRSTSTSRRLPGRRPVRAHVDALAGGLALRADRGPLVGDAAMTRASDTPRLAFRDIDDVAAALRAAGGRFSAVRQRVLQAMFDADGPLPADAVAARARPGVGLPRARVPRGARRRAPRARRPRPRAVPAHGRRRARVPRVRALPPRHRGRAGAARRRARARSRPSSACGRASRTSRSSGLCEDCARLTGPSAAATAAWP